MSVESAIEETLARLQADRWLAHQFLFKHRHGKESAPAHRDLVGRIYAPAPRQLIEGFRGIAKSTHLEEAAIIKGVFREFKNMVLVGSSYDRACERLASVKREFEQNEDINYLFGDLRARPWGENKIVLRSGICIQALGRDQSTLGIKHFDDRPDAALVDDVEDPEEKRTDVEREGTWLWFIRTFLPSLDHPLYSWVRVLGTRRGTGSLPERLEKDGWPTTKYPIEYLDDGGKRQATWPAKFPLADIDEMKKTYRGDLNTWEQEYMCRATSEATRVFTREMLKVEPRVRRRWQDVQVMYDPARTTNRLTSATTGKAVWSWERGRLVFWRMAAELWKPDEIIDDMFQTNAEFAPTWINFEKTGLNDWAMQPIRQEMSRRRVMLPLKGIEAPRGKLDFIRGLQPFAANGEISFAEPPGEDVIGQFLSFPTGRIDAPNAAAYALLLRPGAPVYDNFTDDMIVEDLRPLSNAPLYLAANSDGRQVTAALIQRASGEFRVLADFVREGAAFEVIADIYAEARLAGDAVTSGQRTIYGEGANQFKMPVVVPTLTRTPIRWIVPPWHMEVYRNVGLVQAVRGLPQAVSQGADVVRGRATLAGLLGQLHQGRPRFLVSDAAGWTLRALAGGYARKLNRGLPDAEPEDGTYRVLMEGIESFVAVGLAREAETEDMQPVSYDKRGVPYASAMPARRG